MIKINIDEQVIRKLNEFNNSLVTKSALLVISERIKSTDTIKELGIKPGGRLYGAEGISYGRFLFICFEEVIGQNERIITIRDVVISKNANSI